MLERVACIVSTSIQILDIFVGNLLVPSHHIIGNIQKHIMHHSHLNIIPLLKIDSHFFTSGQAPKFHRKLLSTFRNMNLPQHGNRVIFLCAYYYASCNNLTCLTNMYIMYLSIGK